MDPFRTQVDIPESATKISYGTKCLLMGSCFSDYIGKIMAACKFPLLMNPFGTLFNPASIADNLMHLMEAREFKPSDLHFHNGLWLSFSHYTGFSGTDRSACLDKINTSVKSASGWLKQCDYLVLTFGTAWIYNYNATGKVVANCHKLPSSDFTRTFMSPGDIIAKYESVLTALQKYNPGLKIIFTLSPVRHWADGAVNNQLSKSVLHYSIQEILKKQKNTFYFPAYEIVMDELRDYRFYADDMLHPSGQAARYIFDRFCDVWLDAGSKEILEKVSAIVKAAGHRPSNPDTASHKNFQQSTLKKIDQLTTLYPFLDFSNEIAILSI